MEIFNQFGLKMIGSYWTNVGFDKLKNPKTQT